MKILVPTDLSENADNALGFAQQLIIQTGGEIILLFTYYAVYDFAAQATRIIGQIEKDAKKALKNIIKNNNPDNLHMDYRIVQGTVDNAVKAAVDGMGIDLVIMGTQGASGLKKALLGSNTADVIKEATVPVLAIPSGAKLEKVKKIAVAVELKKEDLQTLLHLMELTAVWNLPYKIIHVQKEGRSDTEINFETLQRNILKEYPLVDINFLSYESDGINKGLENYLKENPDALLVMFSKTRSFFEQLLESSRSVEMAYHTHVPLLVVKSS
ncbi:universal stress protein [Anditalea andensis]|uniref:Universal stress protein UspA n=1 Tax=Anditalea andensis TaxID=1048983 RepID=A0A074L4G2_9BACT|nr:universal stress protein [Anditalea andensis]KEO75380.1 universal stress protein UspA [Anditalea andensis]